MNYSEPQISGTKQQTGPTGGFAHSRIHLRRKLSRKLAHALQMVFELMRDAAFVFSVCEVDHDANYGRSSLFGIPRNETMQA